MQAAAGSGVGSAAIQIAKALGAWVVTTAGSDEKVQAGLDLGADAGINYREQPRFSERVKELTGGEGVSTSSSTTSAPTSSRRT